jgi:hypothetical protein
MVAVEPFVANTIATSPSWNVGRLTLSLAADAEPTKVMAI